ncbi:MAG: hypothetical protein O2857_20010 [Planctomycetota bacterium]|nr:hypothetical protein [Planctomycetota bacterium]
MLGPKVNLTGRNEIRLSTHAILSVDHGTVSSLRWIDIHPGATLTGSGTIAATTYNNGLIAVTGAKNPKLNIHADYRQANEGTLSLPVGVDGKPAFSVRQSRGSPCHLDREGFQTFIK